MSSLTFVGFGFGPIQAGLFLYEAFRSGKFQRLVVAEVAPDLVDALRCSRGCYRLNIAGSSGLMVQEVCGVELLNPTVPEDAKKLERALAEASEVATALPSVDFYDKGRPSVAEVLAQAVARKISDGLPPCIVYTAENHNHAAQILEEKCSARLQAFPGGRLGGSIQFLNTVIGKMSGVIQEREEMAAQGLAPITDSFPRAFLVEEFNRILITKINLPGFHRGIEVFEEKPDLLPFEEAKLYGHNAVHAMLGFLAHRKGYRCMSEIANDKSLFELGREAFLFESRPALLARYSGLEPLFTEDGFQNYAEDLLSRMLNPYLRDRVERVIRDPRRKLGWDDRFIGTMRLALDAGVTPTRFALGAAAALESAADSLNPKEQLQSLWPVPDSPPGRKAQLQGLIAEAAQSLKNFSR